MPITHFRRWFLMVAAASMFAAGAGFAQTDSPPTPPPGDNSEGANPDAATPADRIGEVAIEVRQVGLRKTRAGEWTGFQVQLTDSADRARDVFVRVEMTDADGDRVVMQRKTVLNPATKQSIWLFGWQPFGDREFRITVYEAIERPGASPDAGPAERYRPARRIGSTNYTLGGQETIEPGTGLIAVLGAATAGLDQYTACRLSNSTDYASPTAHELTETIGGLKPDDLPDRWQGLAAFEALVWTGRDANEQPANIGDTQAEAIREWVRRGGHFIVVLPSIGQTWFSATGATAGGGGTLNPLADIMPEVRPTMTEGVDLEKYRQLLTASQLAPLPKNAVVYSFDEHSRSGPSAGPFDAMSIMKGESGDTVVVRRLVGAGAVTVIGIDLARRDLQAKDALQAGQFWNRVLGKRMRVFSPAELSALRSGNNEKNIVALFGASRQAINFDAIIGSVIAKQGKAAAGLLAAFVVFLAYWAIAGPLGYLVLKQRNKRQHSWLVFVAATGLFTLVGWGSSSALKLGRDVDKHYTLLDHVYGQPSERMRTWVELTLPKYGEQRVSVRSPGEVDPGKWHHSLTAWEAGIDNSTQLHSFPDARDYTVDAKAPDTADFPARATTRQLQIDFAGAPPASWGMIRPVAAEGVALGREIYIEEPPGEETSGDRQSADRRWKIQGRLVHNLPGPLRDVHVFVVREMLLGKRQSDALAAAIPAVVLAGKGPTTWEPGDALDLESVVPKNTKDTRDFFLTLRGKASQGFAGTGVGALPSASVSLFRAAFAQAFYPMLEPPDPGANAEIWAVRQSTHGWDLGRWFTQPCVIVVGLLGEASGENAVECPVPISIDGASVEEVRKNIRGVTVIRWIYPLPPRPPVAEPRSPLEEVDPPVPAAGQKPGVEKPN